MKTITIYPKDQKQQSLLQSLLKEMKIHFKIERSEETLSEEAFYAKVDKSIEQAEAGKLKTLPPENQKEMLGL